MRVGFAHRMCRFIARLPVTLAAGMALALSGCNEGGDNAESASASTPPPPVTVAAPLVQRITEWDEFTGRFEATESVDIRARVSGYLQAVNFSDGQFVEQGQVLFVIDPRPYEAAVAAARAQVESARARVDLADAELSRAGQLVDRSAVSQSTYDQRVQEKRVAEAEVSRAEAALEQAQLELEFTSVRAPISGRISNRRVDLGNLVSGDPNATLLTSLVALDPIYFVFDMSESELLAYQRAVASGELRSTRDAVPIQVRLPDEPDTDTWPRAGTMNFVDNRVDPNSGTIRARAILPNEDLFLTPGQFGRLRLPASLEYEALLVPDSAILIDQSNRIVMAVGPDDTVEPRVIRPGPSRPGGLRIVRSGLEPSDRVIINGLIRVRPGMKVTPQPGVIEPDPASGS